MSGKQLFEHVDTLGKLNQNLPLAEKLEFLHEILRGSYEFIDRISIALYDAKTETLKTYTHSSDGDNPLPMYEAKLSDAPSLRQIIDQGKSRVVQDLAIFADSPHEHARRIAAKGYRSSYTMPFFHNGNLLGFLFFNSFQPTPFDTETLAGLDIFGHLITSVITNELTAIRTLLATVQAARGITHHRDVETGAHVDRTAHYARLIAKALAPQYGFSDEFIEHIFMFSPLHDIGKIGVPDKILHKPGKLNDEEYEVMKTHTVKGREIINELVKDFGLDNIQHVKILGNIAEYHHEAVDGSGYPSGLHGDGIPIEARISSVADVFDALTSKRPYKTAWGNAESIAILQRLAGNKLDRDCVDALVKNLDKVLEIQHRFQDENGA
ncbi:MAG: HD domain-containing protein [Gammaproteobacteria bacterium]|nr:HD domain-containing protein [Gammaproteobacteria bacterium]